MMRTRRRIVAVAAGSPIQTDRRFRFGPFELSERDRELSRNGIRIKLQEQPLRVLLELVANAGRVVTREELQQKLWPADTFVDFDLGLNTAVRKLRQTLGDDAEGPRYIETLAKQGYRFVAPVSSSAPVPQPIDEQVGKVSANRTWVWIAAGVCGIAAVIALVLQVIGPPRVPQVTGVTQLTDDGQPKWNRMVTDGSRIYFNEGSMGSAKIVQVSVTGGQTGTVPTTLEDAMVEAIEPDASGLLVGSSSVKDSGLWSVPLPVGEPRHFANLKVENGTADFFPDGRILFIRGSDIYAAEKDGSNVRKLFAVDEGSFDPRVSPDGQKIAVSTDSENRLLVRRLDGSVLRDIPSACCGQWTPDGKYIVYSYLKRGSYKQWPMLELWALPVESGFFHRSQEPVRLTNGPLAYGNRGTTISRDGKQIFALGKQWKGELVRYDTKSKQFLPFLSGISAIQPTFSKDGKWVVYTSYQDRSTWRSRADGTERIELSSISASSPLSISPDGKQLVFSTDGGETYLTNMDGASPPRKIVGAGESDVASWSPDGKFLLLTSTAEDKPTLQVLDLQSGKHSLIPASKEIDVFAGFNTEYGIGVGWWLTQNVLVVSGAERLASFDFKTQKWSELLSGDFQSCAPSPDSKYIYCATKGAEPNALRVRLSDNKVETITNLKNLHRSGAASKIAVAPDGSAIFTRDVGTQEVYALTVNWP